MALTLLGQVAPAAFLSVSTEQRAVFVDRDAEAPRSTVVVCAAGRADVAQLAVAERIMRMIDAVRTATISVG